MGSSFGRFLGRWCVLVFAILVLTACAGGGGGGDGGGGGGGGGGDGGGGSSSRGQGVTLSALAYDAAEVRKASILSDAIGAGPAAGLTTPDPAKGVNGFQYSYNHGLLGSAPGGNAQITQEGATLKVTAADGVHVFTPDDAVVFSNGLVGATIDEGSRSLTYYNTGIIGISGTEREIAAVMLGGKAVGLEFTNFGFWEDRVALKGTRMGGAAFDSTVSSYSPFILESTSAVKKAPAAGTFNGTVLANAYDYTDPSHSKTASLVGTAKLLLLSGASGNLEFVFPNYYTMSVDLSIDGSGAITPAGLLRYTEGSKNTTGIDTGVGGGYELSGQFYGASGSPNATEAVGKFKSTDDTNAIGVQGSFGVKR
jgi:hypothetical protein